MRILKKISLSVAILTISSLQANYLEFAFNYSPYKIHEYQNFKSIRTDLNLKTKRELQEFEKKFGQDPDLKQGLYYLLHNTQKANWNGKRELFIPNYNEAFKSFSLSARKDNLLGAYLGLKVLEQNFLQKGNSIGKQFVRGYARPLAKADYDYGTFWFGRSFLGGYSLKKPNYDKVIIIDNSLIRKISQRGNRTEAEDEMLFFLKSDVHLAKTMRFLRKGHKNKESQAELKKRLKKHIEKKIK